MKLPLRRWVRKGARQVRLRFVRHVSVPRAATHIHGPRPPALAPDEVVVICMVRNGAYWADEFLRHHRQLGVRHFVIIDNDSTDDTRERFAGHDDVSLYSLLLPFNDACLPVRAWGCDRFAHGRWALILDIDELFEYPDSSRRSLAELVGALRQAGATAMPALMLDMYAAEPLRWDDTRAFDRARFDRYDAGGIDWRPYPPGYGSMRPSAAAKVGWGGVRRRVLGVNSLLIKHPLVFNDGRLDVAHSAHFVRRGVLSETTGAVLHYKLVPGFADQVNDSLVLQNHWQGSLEHVWYRDGIAGRASLDLMYSGTRRLERIDQLVDEGLLRVGPEWARPASS